MYYVRVIEADSDFGVKRSIFDATRYDEWGAKMYRVSTATASQKNTAVKFCIGELGSSYSLLPPIGISSSETNWYCSELIWAAYGNAGIWLASIIPGISNFVLPKDISINSSETTIIDVKK